MPTAGRCARQTGRIRRTPSTPSPSPKRARAYSLLHDAHTRQRDVISSAGIRAAPAVTHSYAPGKTELLGEFVGAQAAEILLFVPSHRDHGFDRLVAENVAQQGGLVKRIERFRLA